MKRIIAVLGVVALVIFGVFGANAQTKRQLVMFYNVENLFDTIKDPVTNDVEFTPQGRNQWNATKYWKKMANLERVFAAIAEENKQFPTIVGVSEIENSNVLEDLVAQPKLLPANYQIVHYDSPDARGVDVGFFYRPDQFKLEGSFPVPVVVEELPNFKTRDILAMWGTIDGERFLFMVAHWPSRRGGQASSQYLRNAAALAMRNFADDMIADDPDLKVVMMGDMNDDPGDVSVSEILGGRLNIADVGPGDYFNPFWQMHRDGYGSLAYQDGWNMFDNMVVSGTLVNKNSRGYQLWKHRRNKYYGNIFNRPFLIQQSGQYRGYPFRTFVGNKFENGFSDHFPVFIYLAK